MQIHRAEAQIFLEGELMNKVYSKLFLGLFFVLFSAGIFADFGLINPILMPLVLPTNELLCSHSNIFDDSEYDPVTGTIVVANYDNLLVPTAKELSAGPSSQAVACNTAKDCPPAGYLANNSDTSFNLPKKVACAKLISDIQKFEGVCNHVNVNDCEADSGCYWEGGSCFSYDLTDYANVKGKCAYWDTVSCQCQSTYKLKRTPLNDIGTTDLEKFIPLNNKNILWTAYGISDYVPDSPTYSTIGDVRDYFHKVWKEGIVQVKGKDGKCNYHSVTSDYAGTDCKYLGKADTDKECKDLAILGDKDTGYFQLEYYLNPWGSKCYTPNNCSQYGNVYSTTCNELGKCLYSTTDEDYLPADVFCDTKKGNADCTLDYLPADWLLDPVTAECKSINAKDMENILGNFWLGPGKGSDTFPDVGNSIGTGYLCDNGVVLQKQGNGLKSVYAADEENTAKELDLAFVLLSNYKQFPLEDIYIGTTKQPDVSEWAFSEDCSNKAQSCYDTAKKIEVTQRVPEECYYRNDNLATAFVAQCIPESGLQITTTETEFDKPVTCNDNNPCTDDTYDPKDIKSNMDGCLFVNKQSGSFCGKDKICMNGSCIDNVCATNKDCDDSNPCTQDTCNAFGAAMTKFCNYSNLADETSCGVNKMCNAGECVEIPYDITVTLKNKNTGAVIKNNSSVSLDCGYAGATNNIVPSKAQNKQQNENAFYSFTIPETCYDNPPAVPYKLKISESAYGFEDLNPVEISSWFDLKSDYVLELIPKVEPKDCKPFYMTNVQGICQKDSDCPLANTGYSPAVCIDPELDGIKNCIYYPKGCLPESCFNETSGSSGYCAQCGDFTLTETVVKTLTSGASIIDGSDTYQYLGEGKYSINAVEQIPLTDKQKVLFGSLELYYDEKTDSLKEITCKYEKDGKLIEGYPSETSDKCSFVTAVVCDEIGACPTCGPTEQNKDCSNCPANICDDALQCKLDNDCADMPFIEGCSMPKCLNTFCSLAYLDNPACNNPDVILLACKSASDCTLLENASAECLVGVCHYTDTITNETFVMQDPVQKSATTIPEMHPALLVLLLAGISIVLLKTSKKRK